MLKVRSCGCRSRFCKHCCRSLGYELQDRLIDVLATFRAIVMLTLTVDPGLFQDGATTCPEKAFRYVAARRCIAKLVRRLRDAGLLQTDRFFFIIEWHKTGFAHYHLVLDASYIDINAVRAIWDSFRPPCAAPAAEGRPGFGAVWFSKHKYHGTRNAVSCANYLTKQLINHPPHGYPDWVLDAKGIRIRRYSTSRHFWNTSRFSCVEHGDRSELDGDAHGDEDTQARSHDRDRDREDDGMTIRQRVARCGATSIVTRVVSERDAFGTLREREQFFGHISMPLARIADVIQTFERPHPRVLVVRDPAAQERLFRLRTHPEVRHATT